MIHRLYPFVCDVAHLTESSKTLKANFMKPLTLGNVKPRVQVQCQWIQTHKKWRKTMRMIITITLVLLILSASGFGQQLGQKALEKVLLQYEAAMTSDSPGVRSSAIYQIAQLKCERPEENFLSVEWTLAKIAKNDHNPLIRVHAELTLAYLQDKALRGKIKADCSLEMNNFYNKLYNEMYTSFVTIVVSN